MKCVYRITNLINGKFYIGATTDFEHRRRQWRDYTSNTDSPVKKDILKFGRENFLMEPLMIFSEDVSNDVLHKHELTFIHHLHPQYNVIGKSRPARTRKKISASLTGKKQSKAMIAKRKASQAEYFKRTPKGCINQGHLKDVLIVEDGIVIHGVKNAAGYLCTRAESVSRAIKKGTTIHGRHILLWSVETSCDECSSVGGKTSCPSKCTTLEKSEEIVHAHGMKNRVGSR